MQKLNRTLKVYSTPGNPSPRINLQGNWVAQLGFSIGDYIQITSNEDNQIVITKVEPEQLPKVNVKTKLNKQTIDVVKEQALYYKTDKNEVIEKALHYYFKKKGVM